MHNDIVPMYGPLNSTEILYEWNRGIEKIVVYRNSDRGVPLQRRGRNNIYMLKSTAETFTKIHKSSLTNTFQSATIEV